MPELRSGEVVGDYILDQPLDEGGQGFIWRAHHASSTSTFVALKILTKPDSTGEVGSLRREIEVLAATAANRSDHIVRVLGGAAEPVPYIVMEYVDGSDLRKELERLRGVYGAEAGHFSQLDAVLVGIAVADALTALHDEGIIHRDVKPANVMMDRRGNIKLTDFGIAKIAGASPVTAINQQPMSLFYAAPEVWDGESVLTSDVYALGATLYELLTGVPPFQGSTTSLYQKHVSEQPDLGALPADTDAGFAELISVCMAKDHTQRPTSRVCRDMLTTIKAEITQRDLDTQSGQRHEPEHLGAWSLLDPLASRPWTWRARHRNSGVEGVVELHFADDLPALEQLIGHARRMVEINPRLVPLGAERLLAVNRFLLGPSEAWAKEPPGRFSYFVVRAADVPSSWPGTVSKALLAKAAQSLSALIQQAKTEGIHLDLSPDEVSLGADGSVHVAHPGLGPENGAEMEAEALDYLRGLLLEADAKTAIEGAPSLTALISVLSQQPRGGPAYEWEEIQTDLVAAKEAEATQIVRRPTTSVKPDDASATRIVPRAPAPEPAPEPPPVINVPAEAPVSLPPLGVTLRPIRAGTRFGAARFELVLANNTTQDQTLKLTPDGPESVISLPESAQVAAGKSVLIPVLARPLKSRVWGPVIKRDVDIRVASDLATEVVHGTYSDEPKQWIAFSGVAAAVAVCAILAFTVLSSGGGGTGGTNPTPVANTARAKLANFEFGPAISEFTTAINAQPNNSALYSGRASAYLSQADLPKAQADANKAIELDAKNAEAYHIRSLVYGTRWNYEDAIKDANKAIELAPTNAIYFAARSLTYADREPAKALQDATKAVELGPNTAEAHVALGSVFRDQKKYAEAEAELAKAINLQPKNGTNYLGRAYIFWVKGDGDQALRKLTEDREIIHSYPLSAAQGHVTRGVFHHGFGQYPDALAEFDKSNAILPLWPSFYFWHGFTSYTQKNFTTALADYNKAIEIAPNWPSLFYLRAVLNRDQNKLVEALADLSKAVSLDGSNASYRSERGFVQFGLKNYTEALADLNQSITLDPEVADSYSRRGNVFVAQNNNQAAVDDLTKAIQRQGTVMQYYLDRGAAYQRLNRITEATADFQKARSLAVTPDEIQRSQAALDSLRR